MEERNMKKKDAIIWCVRLGAVALVSVLAGHLTGGTSSQPQSIQVSPDLQQKSMSGDGAQQEEGQILDDQANDGQDEGTLNSASNGWGFSQDPYQQNHFHTRTGGS
jgi:hypothetical protein